MKNDFNCTINFYFIFNNDVYLQVSTDDLGSLLAPVLTNIFMIQLESLLILFFTETRYW